MAELNIPAVLPELLMPWFHANRRELPWRADRDPYHIWISEIMLQQTRVEAVKGYYTRFLSTLPTIESLAVCDDEVLAKLWEGLGYYSRMRNLKKAAQLVVEQFGGVFPGDYDTVISLPGIGEYTAGAICSIAFGAPTPAVDGNVLRVVSRLMNDDTPVDLPLYKKSVRDGLAKIYPPDAGEFTQALMELGATVCGPNRKPDCECCPCREICLAQKAGTAESLPKKQPKKDRREENLTVLILSYEGKTAVDKRPEKGLLAGLWQFPNCKGTLQLEEVTAVLEGWGIRPKEILRQSEKSHIFTHIQWNMTGWYLECSNCGGNFRWLTAEEIEQDTALPTAFRQFWEDNRHV